MRVAIIALTRLVSISSSGSLSGFGSMERTKYRRGFID